MSNEKGTEPVIDLQNKQKGDSALPCISKRALSPFSYLLYRI